MSLSEIIQYNYYNIFVPTDFSKIFSLPEGGPPGVIFSLEPIRRKYDIVIEYLKYGHIVYQIKGNELLIYCNKNKLLYLIKIMGSIEIFRNDEFLLKYVKYLKFVIRL